MTLNINGGNASPGWDPDVEKAFDTVLEAAQYMVDTCQVPDVMTTWPNGSRLLKYFSKEDVIERLSQEQRDELVDCLVEYYEQFKEMKTTF